MFMSLSSCITQPRLVLLSGAPASPTSYRVASDRVTKPNYPQKLRMTEVQFTVSLSSSPVTIFWDVARHVAWLVDVYRRFRGVSASIISTMRQQASLKRRQTSTRYHGVTQFLSKYVAYCTLDDKRCLHVLGLAPCGLVGR